MKLNFCVLCGSKENLHHHHVIPKVKGGTDDEDNLITLCEKHHEMIHNIQQCDDFSKKLDDAESVNTVTVSESDEG